MTQGNVQTFCGNGQTLDLNSDKVWTLRGASGHRNSVLNVRVRFNWGWCPLSTTPTVPSHSTVDETCSKKICLNSLNCSVMVEAVTSNHIYVGPSPSLCISFSVCLILTDSAALVRWVKSCSIFILHKRDRVTQCNVQAFCGNGQTLDLNSDKVWTLRGASGHRMSVLNVRVRFNWGWRPLSKAPTDPSYSTVDGFAPQRFAWTQLAVV